MELSKDDANNLAVPIVAVAAEYGLDVKVDPKLEAWGNLIMALAWVYGPKLMAMQRRARGDNARNVTPRPNGADMTEPTATEIDFSKMTQGKFH
jgi:hypothetical protein